ncbi:MAG: rod-binding protein [Pseudohongiellaceae bacterium]
MDSAKAAIYSDFSGLASLKRQASSDPQQAAREVAQQFESIFVGMMVKSMRDTLPEDSLFGSHQMEAYQEMFDNQLAVDLSRKGGLGLADIIERQITASSMYQANAEE